MRAQREPSIPGFQPRLWLCFCCVFSGNLALGGLTLGCCVDPVRCCVHPSPTPGMQSQGLKKNCHCVINSGEVPAQDHLSHWISNIRGDKIEKNLLLFIFCPPPPHPSPPSPLGHLSHTLASIAEIWRETQEGNAQPLSLRALTPCSLCWRRGVWSLSPDAMPALGNGSKQMLGDSEVPLAGLWGMQ